MGWICALEFDGAHPEFGRGMEAGYIYGLLAAKPKETLTTWVAASNAEMMLRIADATGRPFQAYELEQPPQNQPRLEITFGPVA